MAIIPTKEEKSSSSFRYSIIILFLMAVVASLATFFWPVRLPDNFKKEAILNPSERKLSELHFNLAVFQDPVFQSLTSYGEFPLTAPKGGRKNPFSF